MTGFAPVMWVVWGALVTVMIGLKVYTMRLTRDEEDQVILDASFDHMRDEQAAILARVNKIAPIERKTMWLVAAMTVVVIVYYAIEMYNKLFV